MARRSASRPVRPDRVNPDDVRLFSGSSHPQLAAGISAHLQVPL